MNVEQDRLYRDESLRRWGLWDRGELYTTGTCLRHVTGNHPRGVRGLPWGLPEVSVIISLTLPPPFLRSAPDRHHLAVEGYSRALLGRGLERCRHTDIYNNNISLLNVWYGSYAAHADYSVTGEKLVIYRKKNPIAGGGKTLWATSVGTDTYNLSI